MLSPTPPLTPGFLALSQRTAPVVVAVLNDMCHHGGRRPGGPGQEATDRRGRYLATLEAGDLWPVQHADGVPPCVSIWSPATSVDRRRWSPSASVRTSNIGRALTASWLCAAPHVTSS